MDDDRFEYRLRARLDQGLEDIDPDVTRRLRLARQVALEQGARRFRFGWVPAAAAVFAGLLMAAIFLRPADDGAGLPDMASDLEIIAADDSLQFYEELDFYQWLATESVSDAG